MRKTNALYLKTQRLIAETHLDTHRDTQRDRQTDTQRHTHPVSHTQTHTKSHTHKHIERAASKVYPSFCYTHESLQIVVVETLKHKFYLIHLNQNI